MTDSISNQPRLSFQSTLGWIGSVGALGWPMIVVLAFWPWLIGWFAETLPGYELAIDIHLYDLLSGFTPALILLAARFALRANQPTRFRGSTARNLTIWFIAAGFGVVGPLWFASQFGPVPFVYWAGIPVGIASVLGQILGYSTVTIVVAELRASAKQLAKKQHALRSLQANLEQKVLGQRQALQTEVEATLSSQLSEIRDQLDQLAGKAAGLSAESVANKIRQTIDLVVRPLSLEIDSTSSAESRAQIRSISELEKEIRRLPFSQRLKLRVPLGHIFNVTFVVFFLFLFVVPSFVFLFGVSGVISVGAPASAIVIALTWLARRLTRDKVVSSVSALLIVATSAVLASLPFALLGELSLPESELGLGLLLAFQAFIVCLLVFLGSLVAEASFIQLDRTKLANDKLRKLLAYLQSEAQINRRSLAQLVHGKVQARLQAASIRLSQAQEVTPALLAEISRDLEAGILDTENTRLDRDPIELQLSEMADQWGGICDLTFTFEPGVASVVDSNAVTKAAVVEVIREAVNNAVKHGDADEADALVSLSNRDEIRVEIRNTVNTDSAANQDIHPRGYGSLILDQVTDAWSLKFTDGDAILTATIKVNQ